MKNNKIIASIKWVFNTIVLGALGSGLWELFVSDLLSWLGLASLEITSDLFAGFKDSLYAQVSDGTIVSYMKLPSVLAAVIVVILPTFLLYKHISNSLVYVPRYPYKPIYRNEEEVDTLNKSEDEKELELVRMSSVNSGFVSIMAVIILAYGFIAFKSLYTAKAATFIEKSLDIVAPHISTEKKLHLQASYRSISDSKSYMLIYSELKSLESELQIKLPEFQPI